MTYTLRGGGGGDVLTVIYFLSCLDIVSGLFWCESTCSGSQIFGCFRMY